jgi:hypothetical protein
VSRYTSPGISVPDPVNVPVLETTLWLTVPASFQQTVVPGAIEIVPFVNEYSTASISVSSGMQVPAA